MAQIITLKCAPLDAPRAREVFQLNGFAFETAPYAFWRARGPGLIATFYEKGKLVLQGPAADEYATVLDSAADAARPADPFDAALALHPVPPPPFWAGIDEAGKGDYFGPLVVCAAAVERERIPLLRELGVADSKTLGDVRIRELARDLKTICPHKKVTIGPERYNALYAKIGNLNRLLAWAHARALEDLLAVAPNVTYAVSDQFASDARVIGRQLGERGRAIVWEQRTKAEADPAVAVASILARDEFLWGMKRVSEVAGRELPKGAGPPVLAAAREVVALHGREMLERVAKLHFKTTEQILR